MSLYQYTPYSPRGQSSGEAFQSGFAGSQAIETNAMRMDEMRQLAQMRELQEQRAQEAGLRQAAEAKRTAQMFPLQLQQAEFNLQQAQRLGPLAVRRGELTNQELERNIAAQGALIAALRGQGMPTMVAPTVPTQATPGVAVPGAIPGFLAPEAVPTPAAPAAPTTPAAPAAATPGPQSELRPSWMNPVPYARAPGMPAGVQVARLGMSDADGAEGAPQPETAAYTGRRTSEFTDVELRNTLRAAMPGGGGPATAGLAALSPEVREDLLREVRIEVARRGGETALSTRPGVRTPPPPSTRVFPSGLAETVPEEATPTAAAPAATPTATPAAAPGTQVAPVGPAPATTPAATPSAQATTAQPQAPSASYILEPLRIGSDQRRLTEEFGQLQRRYQTALAARDRAGLDQITTRMNQINQELTFLNGMTAITQFRNGDAAPLAGVLHRESGGRLSFQPRSDGTFNVFLDGRLSRQGVTRDEIETSARMQFDTRFQQQVQQQRQRDVELSIFAARQRIEQMTRVSAEGILEEIKSQLRPDLDVQRVTMENGQQVVLYVDKRTRQTVGGVRIVQVPPPPGSARGAQPTFTIEPLPVGQR